MNFLGAVILVALLLLVVFTLANWAVLSAPATLSFIVFDVDGPLGVILLGAMLVLVVLFILYALAHMLMELRRHNQELEAQRKLAEVAEASRLGELRAQVEREFAEVRGQMDRHEQSMKQALDEAANGLAALVGEMDDKIDRALARGATETKGP